ncbi:MAG: amidohydrolase family protein, partial [Actinomycetes bacterium]
MIIDAHHHVWDPAERAYPWMGPDVAPLRRRFDLGDYLAATAGTGVTAGVIVQATSSVEETEHLLGLAAGSAAVAGVVGWVDLRAPDMADTLARLKAGVGGSALVGVRHQVEDEPDPAWLADPATVHGLRAVAAAGLTFDLLVRPRQLAAAVTAAHAVPELPMILDHGAKPPIAD